MILDAIRELYEDDAKDHIGRGNPTGSRWGACAAQSQLLRYPAVGKPEPPRPRQRMTWEMGDRVEAWWSSVIERAFPKSSGLAQEPMYFAVPIDASQVDGLARRIALHGAEREKPRAERNPDGLWGTVRAGFRPPSIVRAGDRIRLRVVARDPKNAMKPASLGFVLDPDARIIWAPSYVDRIWQDPTDGQPWLIEKKSMSNHAFRRAAMGDLGYGLRCQLAGTMAATNLPAVWLLYRKETSHTIEIIYSPTVDRTRVQITKLNGQSEVFFVTSPGQLTTEAGAPAAMPADLEWDDAAVWTPYEPGLLEAIRERIRRVLFFDGDRHSIYREYGPNFVCSVCDGTGVQTRAKNAKKLLKTPKPCEDCEGGMLDAVDLPWQCSYCPCVLSVCYPMATLTLDMKPHYTITRAAFVVGGLTFVSPEGSLTARPPAADQPPADAGLSPAPAIPECKRGHDLVDHGGPGSRIDDLTTRCYGDVDGGPVVCGDTPGGCQAFIENQSVEASRPADGRVRVDKQAGDGRHAASAAGVEGPGDAAPAQRKFLDW
mgnify:CR=1 FL=1